MIKLLRMGQPRAREHTMACVEIGLEIPKTEL